MKKRKLKYDRNIDKDVVLCTTGNAHIERRTADYLLKHEVPFSKRVERTSVFERLSSGHDRLFVISVNRNEYALARRVLDGLDPMYRNRLTLNVI